MPGTRSKKRTGIQAVEIGIRVLEAAAGLGQARPLAAIGKIDLAVAS